MKILYVTDFLPYPSADHGGGKMFSYYIDQMSKAGNSIDLLSITRLSDAGHYHDLEPLVQNVYSVFASRSYTRLLKRLLFTLGMPPEYAFCRSIGMDIATRKILHENRYDIIHVVQPWLLHTVLEVWHQCNPQTRLIGHAIDVSTKVAFRKMQKSHGLRRTWQLRQFAQQANLEFSDYQKCDCILTHSASDEVYIRSMLTSDVPIVLTPVWFDAMNAIVSEPAPRQGHDILYVGNSADPRTRDAVNWLIRDIMPNVVNQIPDVTLHIVSVRPQDMHLWEQHPYVRCHTFTDSILEYYDRCALFVAPLTIGGGQHLKILNAFARGCPTIITSVANDGLQALHNDETMIADDAETFASLIVSVLSNQSIAYSIAHNALTRIKSLYAHNSIVDSLNRAYTMDKSSG